MGSRTARWITTAADLAVCARSMHTNMSNPERRPAVQHLTPPTDSRSSPCLEGWDTTPARTGLVAALPRGEAEGLPSDRHLTPGTPGGVGTACVQEPALSLISSRGPRRPDVELGPSGPTLCYRVRPKARVMEGRWPLTRRNAAGHNPRTADNARASSIQYERRTCHETDLYLRLGRVSLAHHMWTRSGLYHSTEQSVLYYIRQSRVHL